MKDDEGTLFWESGNFRGYLGQYPSGAERLIVYFQKERLTCFIREGEGWRRIGRRKPRTIEDAVRVEVKALLAATERRAAKLRGMTAALSPALNEVDAGFALAP